MMVHVMTNTKETTMTNEEIKIGNVYTINNDRQRLGHGKQCRVIAYIPKHDCWEVSVIGSESCVEEDGQFHFGISACFLEQIP
jgi:hypothetical protein